jgi:hypothetical protein
MRWSDVPAAARVFRVVHAAWGVVGMLCLGYVWLSAVLRRRDRLLSASVAFLTLEGAALVVGRGDCPFGPFQRRLGDPVPLFELVLPPKAAKAAVPLLAGISLAAFVAVAARRPRSRTTDTARTAADRLSQPGMPRLARTVGPNGPVATRASR